VSWGAYLYLYERLKAWHRERQGQAQGSKLSTTWNLLSAAQAGAMVSTAAAAAAAARSAQPGTGNGVSSWLL
jgi:hypothetical protein